MKDEKLPFCIYVVFLGPGTGLGVSPLPLFSPGSPEFGIKPGVGAGRLQGSYVNVDFFLSILVLSVPPEQNLNNPTKQSGSGLDYSGTSQVNVGGKEKEQNSIILKLFFLCFRIFTPR